jgi:hypothetical protein
MTRLQVPFSPFYKINVEISVGKPKRPVSLGTKGVKGSMYPFCDF